MSEFRKVITAAGEVIDFESVFEENPYLRTGVPTKTGSVERVDYETSVYEDGVTYKKYCYVYLPYCYDPADTGRRYNVLYYQHGNSCEPGILCNGGNKYMLDMLFESGEIEPCLIVSTTYYMDPWADAETRATKGFTAAGDGFSKNIPANFGLEVVGDILPAVELKYNTYLTENTHEAKKASRDHRAFTGYSRGGAMTWRMINSAFEYFRWFAPMSCDTHGKLTWADPITDEEVAEFIHEPILKNPELPFFIYASNGRYEDIAKMNEQMKALVRAPFLSFGTDPAKNNFYFCLSDYYHTDYLVPYYYWNSLKVIFK